MPSKALGTGMCPRCGKPGTVVIKAGNYVYIKHGNTWHYIGTIDKVNLNKILIKDNTILEELKENNLKHDHKYIKNHKIKILPVIFALVIISIITLSLIFLMLYNHNNKQNINNFGVNAVLTGCHYIKSANDTIFFISCNITNVNVSNNHFNIKYISNLTDYNVTAYSFNYLK
ncbi:hypothetical protein [Vulcanisaeta distributa]|uniref:Uncharacterized protein n=1 Tax=Vulcanisaeta distributa (strain DSM 14429 / JCM 11212 / NBRC 100878 / IC-017) TaxID=572478 RepID=E1QPV1_VULDI|nr:hypothetical protein [Vulcanisaeta distributa]ADN51511.1 hypothetical protein Vdis_2142 [Vulcanisaeta distributa DSM 14429]